MYRVSMPAPRVTASRVFSAVLCRKLLDFGVDTVSGEIIPVLLFQFLFLA